MPDFHIIHKDHNGVALGECTPNNLSFGMPLNDVGYIQYDLDDNHPLANYLYTRPYVTDWELWVDDIPLMGGLHTSINRASADANAITVAGKDWLHYLEKRFYPFDPTNIETYWYSVGTTDVYTILTHLLDTTLGRKNSLGLTYSFGSFGSTIDYAVTPGDMEDIASKLKSLSEGSPGFDFEITYDKQILLYSPHKVSVSNLYFIAGQNLLDVNWTDNGPTSTYFLGIGTGPTTMVGQVGYGWHEGEYGGEDDPLSPVYRRLDSGKDFGTLPTDELDNPYLKRLTRGESIKAIVPKIELPLSVIPDINFWTYARPGVVVNVEIDDQYENINSEYRIVGIEYTSDDEGLGTAAVTVDDTTI